MNMLVFPALAEEDAALGEDRELLIRALGIADYEPNDAEALTRGEWTQLLSAAVFGTDGMSVGGDKLFADVEEGSEFYNEISRFYGMNVVNGYKNGSFGAEDALTMEQAVVTMMRTLYRNVDFSGILSQKKGDLLDDTKISDTDKISLNNAYIMICNMMYEEVLTVSGKDSCLFREYRRDIYKVSGVVSDDSKNSVFGESEYNGDEIVIDGKLYTNTTGVEDLFGYYVNDGEATLLSVAKGRRNSEIMVYSDNIEEYDPDTRTYHYYKDDKATNLRKEKLATDIITVYNGRTIGISDTSFKPENYKPTNGFIKILDNNGDGNAEVVFIYDYQTGIVTANDLANEKIYFKLEKEPLLLEDVSYTVYDADMNPTTIEAIAEDTILSYAVSADGKVAQLVASSNITEDICVSADLTDKLIQTKAGGEYSLSDYFVEKGNVEKVKSGRKYYFYFDMFNKVVYAKTPGDNTWSVAYLMRTVSDDNEERYYVRLIGFGEKMTELELAEKVNVNKEDNTKAKLKSSIACTYLTDYISSVGTASDGYSSLVRYKTDSEGKLSEIELPLGANADMSKADSDRLCTIVNSAAATIQYQSSGHFLGQCAVDAATVGMELAKGEEESIAKKKTDLVNNGKYKLIAYTTKRGSMLAEYILFPIDDSAAAAFSDDYFIVADIHNVYDEDDGEVTELNGWYVDYYNRQEKTIRLTDTAMAKSVKDFAGNSYKLSAGDVIYISLTPKKDEINAMYMIYDADGAGTMGDKCGMLAGAAQPYYTGTSNYGNPYGFTVNSTTQAITCGSGDYAVTNRIFLGYMKEVNSSAITATTQPLAKTSAFNYSLDKSKYFTEILPGLSSKIIKLDRTGKKTVLSQGTLSDLKSCEQYSGGCSKVLLLQREWVTIAVIVIEE